MKLEIDHKSSIPLHLQIENLIRDLAKLEEYADGNKFLPKEVDLAKTLGVSRNTVRKSISKLVYEGLLERKKGTGTTVKSKEITTSLADWHSFTEEMNHKGIPFDNLHVNAEMVDADEKLADIFDIRVGTKLVKLERIRGVDNEPDVFFISWFHPDTGITVNENFYEPLYKLMESKFSIIPKISNEKIKAKVASDEISAKLGISSGVPILFRERKVLDHDRQIIEFNIGYYRADRFTYTITINS